MLDFLSGGKTFLGGLVLIGGGVALIALLGQTELGITLIGNGISVWGIGHKIEKLTEALTVEKVVNSVGKELKIDDTKKEA